MATTALAIPAPQRAVLAAAGERLGRQARRFIDAGGARAILNIAATAGMLLPTVAPVAAAGRWARLALGAGVIAHQARVTLRAWCQARSTPAPRS